MKENYKNFNAAIYCPVKNLIDIKDFEKFGKEFDWIEKNINVGKVYLETYRHGTTIDEKHMKKVIDFFKQRGIETSGGITTDGPDDGEGGFNPLCYTSESTRTMLTEVVEFTASLFDEVILDDFYFTNCRCESCIEAKKDRTWSEFRIELMKEISE
ncbi:MAG TPA: permease, partial [Clostridiales bacterium]|nr:permease [Clostridiales bacterium]